MCVKTFFASISNVYINQISQNFADINLIWFCQKPTRVML